MCTGTEKARIVMDDEIHRNIMDIFFKAPFIFKCGTETGGFEELKEARHDTARNKHAAKCPEIERQIAAKTAHNDKYISRQILDFLQSLNGAVEEAAKQSREGNLRKELFVYQEMGEQGTLFARVLADGIIEQFYKEG